MSNHFASTEYNIYTTQDGSPTMSLRGGEKMHSLHGALSESLYIYKPTISAALKHCQEPHILSMGLGLAYNELIALALLASADKKHFSLASYEKEDFLNQSLVLWLQEQTHALTATYDIILSQIAEHFQMSPPILKSFAQEKWLTGLWTLNGELPHHSAPPNKFHALLYDAFSGQSDKDLWEEGKLNMFLKNYADPDLCFLSTYAATGNLTRALKSQGFFVEKKKGFGVKRESTWASRPTVLSS